tara:strand:+ start:425 stop:922 length:498 start_codon:yes stop_codon:yes gene_type:complete
MPSVNEEIKKVLTEVGKDIVNQSKKNLSAQNISTSGQLAKTMDSKAKIVSSSVELNISIAGHWEYMNYGVAGVGGVKADKSIWVKKKVTNNKYKYRDHIPPPSAFSKITSDRGGQFAIAKSIFHTGLKTTLFFSNPFEAEVKGLSERIEESLAKSIEDSLGNETE